jgi:hypothetical protein
MVGARILHLIAASLPFISPSYSHIKHAGTNGSGGRAAGVSRCFQFAHFIGIFRLYFQPAFHKFCHVKGVFRVRIRQVLILWVLRNVEFVTEKRPYPLHLQNTFAAVHHRKFIRRHQLFATMSSDEFKNGQKNSPSPGRRRTIMLLFSCHLDFSHKIISNPDFLFLFPINFWDFTSQNMAN